MLNGKVAIVTGGTRGIGMSIVKTYLDNHAKVAVFGSRKETVDKAINELKRNYNEENIIGLYPNLSKYEEVKESFKKVIDKFGKIDILVNNAGISARESIYDYKIEDFDKIMNLNVNAVFNCSKAVASYMKENGGGCIINASSMVSLYGQRSGVGYPASKFAVNGMTKSLARELGGDNIRVNAVAPGVIKTDMVSALPKDMVERLIQTIPLGRMGEPEDVANVYLFLASNLASYVTGAVISVDGATIS